VDRVRLGLGEAAEGDQIALSDPDPGLLGQLIDGGASEAPAWLGRAGRQAPGSIVGALGQQYAAVPALQRDHRAGHEDEVIAHRLP
jgi:hypothetical protein